MRFVQGWVHLEPGLVELMLLVQVLEPVPTTFLPFLVSLHGLGPCLALSAGCTKTIKWYVSFGMSLPVVAPRES